MRKKKHGGHVNHERWLVSYADFITLLFAFFVVMFSVSQVDSKKVGRFSQSFQSAMGLDLSQGGKGMLPGEGAYPLPADKPPGNGKPEDEEKKKKQQEQEQKSTEELKKIQQSLEAQAKAKRELAGLKVLRRGNELVLRLDEAMLFTSGDDKVTDQARITLKAIGEELKDRPVRVRIEGHTDNQPIARGRFRSNWDLSTARATSVVTEIALDGDVGPERLSAVGYSEYQPLGDNTTLEGRAQNRRVDIVLTVPLPSAD